MAQTTFCFVCGSGRYVDVPRNRVDIDVAIDATSAELLTLLDLYAAAPATSR